MKMKGYTVLKAPLPRTSVYCKRAECVSAVAGRGIRHQRRNRAEAGRGKGDKRGRGRHYPPVAAGGVDLGELRLHLRLRRRGRHRGGEGARTAVWEGACRFGGVAVRRLIGITGVSRSAPFPAGKQPSERPNSDPAQTRRHYCL